MTSDEFLSQFAEIVEVDAGSIALDTPLKDVATWDSLSHVSFLAFLDEQFGKSVEPEALEQAEKVSDLWAMASA